MKQTVLIVFLAVIAGCAMLFDLGRTGAHLDVDEAASAASSVNPNLLTLRRKVAAMSIDEKIGAMLMVAIPDAVLSPHTADWLRMHHIGGVILLGQNVRSRE